MSDALTRIETFSMNGTASSVNTAFPIAFLPVVRVAGVQQTLKQAGVDAWGLDYWYWEENNTTVFQGLGTVPAALTSVVIEYQSAYSNVIVATVPSKITSLAIDGRSGYYQTVIDVRGVVTEEQAQEIASAFLRKSSAIPSVIQIESDEPWIEPNMVLTFTVAAHALSGAPYCVTQVQSNSIAGTDLGHGSSFRRKITCALVQTAPAQSPAATDPTLPATNADFNISPEQFFYRALEPARITEAAAPKSMWYKFILGVGTDIAGGTVLTNKDDVVTSGTLVRVTAIATIPPTGQTLVIDILANGVSIFGDTQMEIGPGDTSLQLLTTFARDPFRLYQFDILTINASYRTSSGTVAAARNVTVTVVCE